MRQKCAWARATSSQAPRSSGERESARTPSAASRLGFDGTGDAAGDFVLQGKDVADLAVVPFGPVMAAGQRIDELRRDAQPRARPADAAFEYIAHAEIARDPLHVDCPALVDECRVAGDDEQPADAGEPGDQILGDAIGKVLLFGIAAHIGERQHRDRGAVGQRQRTVFSVRRLSPMSFRLRMHTRAGRRFFLADFADEADALARQRLDQPLLLAGVRNRAPSRVDPVEKRRF